MPRRPRRNVIEPGRPVHVILRGNNRRRLFCYRGCYFRFLGYLREALETTGCRLHAVALMGNHVHLVITPPDAAALSACIGRTAQRYAAHHNRARGGTGKLFEERFTAIPVRDEAQLATLLAYVDLNPVRAGLAASPDDYAWTTYRSHAGLLEEEAALRAIWTSHDWYLGLGATAATRAARYVAWVRSRCDDELEHIATESRDRDDERRATRARLERPDRSSAR